MPGRAAHPATSHLEPGQRVRLTARPDWGDGQVQSVVGARVTINFENAGKVVVNAEQANLEVVHERP